MCHTAFPSVFVGIRDCFAFDVNGWENICSHFMLNSMCVCSARDFERFECHRNVVTCWSDSFVYFFIILHICMSICGQIAFHFNHDIFFFICVCLPSSGIYFDNSHGGFVLGCDIYLISAPQQQQKLYIYRSCMSFVVFKEIKLHYGISLLILMIFSFSAEFKNRLHNGLKRETIRKHTDRNNVMAIINDIYL